MIPRVFAASAALIEGSDVNYLKNVLRLKVGDEVIVIDNKNKEYSSRIESFEKKSIKLGLTAELRPRSGSKVNVTIAQGLPKNPKMDIVVQKATELGAAKIIPMKTERSIVKVYSEKEKSKVDRWQKIAKEAAEQSGRLSIPLVEKIQDLKEVLGSCKDCDGRVILWEMEKAMTIKAFLQANKGIKDLFVLIGPEGGFSHDEVELAKKNGFTTVSIGSRILRTETASAAVLSMINYEFEL
ncbi:MAG: 16S rRNA (uracil(1498)-N(3))-methyltransferase [bacterium]